MDLRQTLRDPYEQIQVKTFNQNNTTPIYAVCDVSSSMQFGSKQSKLELAMQISASIAYSADGMGDLFGLIAYNNHVIEDFTLPLSHHLFNSLEVIQQLANYQNKYASSEGVVNVPMYLSQHRSLVFWISDFHMPLELIEQTLNAMSAHQVVPIVLWDDKEHKNLPQFGFGNLIDRALRPEHAVIDFMNVGIGPVRTGIFNIADMVILGGVIALVLMPKMASTGKAANTIHGVDPSRPTGR
jgi:hypothetical protein